MDHLKVDGQPCKADCDEQASRCGLSRMSIVMHTGDRIVRIMENDRGNVNGQGSARGAQARETLRGSRVRFRVACTTLEWVEDPGGKKGLRPKWKLDIRFAFPKCSIVWTCEIRHRARAAGLPARYGLSQGRHVLRKTRWCLFESTIRWTLKWLHPRQGVKESPSRPDRPSGTGSSAERDVTFSPMVFVRSPWMILPESSG